MTDFPTFPRDLKVTTHDEAAVLRQLAGEYQEQSDRLPQESALRAHLRREATVLRTRVAEFEQRQDGS